MVEIGIMKNKSDIVMSEILLTNIILNGRYCTSEKRRLVLAFTTSVLYRVTNSEINSVEKYCT